LRLVLEDVGGIVVPSQVELPRVYEEMTPEKQERKNAVLKQELQELLLGK
jgi:hypothetical protein